MIRLPKIIDNGYVIYPNSDIYNRYGRKLKPRILHDGTKIIRLYVDSINGRIELKRRLHILMANAYNLKSPIRFKDGNRSNCDINNLV
jgi:hypothetical protein